MDLSIKWLSDYVDIDFSPREFSEKMTMSGTKVEGYTLEAKNLKNIIVGEILEIKPHPDADKLIICEMNVGAKESVTIVTGADNVKVSDLVPVAMHKSTTADGTKITRGKLRGVMSNGMLCSLDELGLTLADFPYASEDGILILQEDCKPGDNIKDALGLFDTSVEFEITSNRADCNSVLGIAREVCATYNKAPLVIKTPVVKGSGEDISDYLSVEVKDPELCNRYLAKVITNVDIKPSPRWIREKLRNSGVRPINNLVDITNFVMLEYGQPMHAFDYDNVEGKKITVRKAKEDEIITTLDKEKIKLSKNMLVIADEKKPVALAGIMGGENSGIKDTTTTVVFESAHFNYSSVRETSKKTGISSESSLRYSKDVDEEIALPALLRACELVELLGAGQVVDGLIKVDNYTHKPVKIKLDYIWINKFIGIDLKEEEMIKILENLDFKVKNGVVTVPSHRKDVTHLADLSEEIARFYGYDKIKITAIQGVADGHFTKRQIFEDKVKNALIACGGSEIVTYSFISPKEYDRILIGEDSPLRDSVKISNPLGEETSIMRTTSLPSMLLALSRNYNNRNLSFSAFELATRYEKVKGHQLPDEKKQVVLGMYGDEHCDFYTLKGYVDALMREVKVKNYEITQVDGVSTFHPGRCGKIEIGGEFAGFLGEAHPVILENYSIKLRTYLGEIDLDLIYNNSNLDIEYKTLPRYPATGRDLAFVADKSVPMLNIEKILIKNFKGILEKIDLFDIYQGENIEKGKKSLAFHLTLRSKDSTLTDEVVNNKVNLAIEELKSIDVHLRS